MSINYPGNIVLFTHYSLAVLSSYIQYYNLRQKLQKIFFLHFWILEQYSCFRFTAATANRNQYDFYIHTQLHDFQIHTRKAAGKEKETRIALRLKHQMSSLIHIRMHTKSTKCYLFIKLLIIHKERDRSNFNLSVTESSGL